MNRRSFVRLLGLAPTAAVLPLAGIAAAAKQAAETAGPTFFEGTTIIDGGAIAANSITATHLRVGDADLGTMVAGRIRSGDGRLRIDSAAHTISLED